MIKIISVDGDKLTFTSDVKNNNFEFKFLTIDGDVFFATQFDLENNGTSYWVSHPRFGTEKKFKIHISREGNLLKKMTFQRGKNNETKVEKKGKVLLKVACSSLGDTLCSTPTIRKAYESYGYKVDVMTKRPDVLIKNPYIDKILPYQDSDVENYEEVFETFNLAILTSKNDTRDTFHNKPMEIKFSNFEARQFHALGLGITLYPEEMHYDFIPDEDMGNGKLVDKNTIVLHVTESWPSRTWSPEKWQKLIDLIKEKTDFKVATIGRSHIEMGHFGEIHKNAVKFKNVDFDFTKTDEVVQQSMNDRESLSEMWHILNNSYGLISFDSGPIHLAGTTDSWIFQIGASVRPEKTAPYRNGKQNYKFLFVGGECKLMCATDPKYSVKEWGTINSSPYYPNCQEGYKEFKCHPSPEMMVNKIIETLN